jgi:hypothetical protein
MFSSAGYSNIPGCFSPLTPVDLGCCDRLRELEVIHDDAITELIVQHDWGFDPFKFEVYSKNDGNQWEWISDRVMRGVLVEGESVEVRLHLPLPLKVILFGLAPKK